MVILCYIFKSNNRLARVTIVANVAMTSNTTIEGNVL